MLRNDNLYRRKTLYLRFQGSQGLSADGVVGNASWPALTVLVQQGDSGAKVRAVQSQLVDSAVRSFQGTKGLGLDGIVGENTWSKFAW